MKVHVVIDTKGQGRLVGVFDKKEPAQQIVDAYPAYYKIHSATINKINKDIIDWADTKDQKKFLKKLIDSEKE